MQFKAYRKEIEENRPPALEAGTILQKVERVEGNVFKFEGKEIKGLIVHADGKKFRTSSEVLIEQLNTFFTEHPNEVLENVKIVQPKGKKYLSLESV